MGPNPDTYPQRGPSTLVIATLVLGLLSFPTGALSGLAGCATGWIEMSNIKYGRSSRDGYGMNLAGLILSMFSVLVMAIVYTLFISAAFQFKSILGEMADTISSDKSISSSQAVNKPAKQPRFVNGSKPVKDGVKEK